MCHNRYTKTRKQEPVSNFPRKKQLCLDVPWRAGLGFRFALFSIWLHNKEQIANTFKEQGQLSLFFPLLPCRVLIFDRTAANHD